MNPEDVVMAQGGPEGPPPEAAPQGPPPEAQQQAEPYGASLLRRVHEDAAMLLMEYDEHLAMLDNPEVRAHMTELLKTIDKLFLGATEKVFKRQYKQLPPLDGGGGAPPEGGPDGGPPPDEGPPDDGGEEFEVAEEGPPEEEAGEEENPKERPTPRPPEKGIGVTGQKSLPRQGVKMPVNKRAMDVGATAYRDSDGETKDDRRGDAVIASQAHIAEEASESIAAGDRDTARRVLGDARDTREAMNRWVDEHGKTLYDLRVGSDGRKYMVPVAVKVLKKPKKGDSRANQEQLADPNKGKIPLKGQKGTSGYYAPTPADSADNRASGDQYTTSPEAAVDGMTADTPRDPGQYGKALPCAKCKCSPCGCGHKTLYQLRVGTDGKKYMVPVRIKAYSPQVGDEVVSRRGGGRGTVSAVNDDLTEVSETGTDREGNEIVPPVWSQSDVPTRSIRPRENGKTLYQLRVGSDGKKYMQPVRVKMAGGQKGVRQMAGAALLAGTHLLFPGGPDSGQTPRPQKTTAQVSQGAMLSGLFDGVHGPGVETDLPDDATNQEIEKWHRDNQHKLDLHEAEQANRADADRAKERNKTLYDLRVGRDGKKYMVPVAVKAYGADHKVTTQRIAREDERRGLDDSTADDWERAHYDMEVEDLAEYGTPTLDDGTNRVKALPPEFALDEELAGIERHPEGVDVNPQGRTAYQQEASLFEQHELGKLQEAVDFLHEIAAEEFNSWGEEHRFKSWHFHKCLEPMGMRVHTKALVGNKSGADDPYGNWGDDGGPVPDYDPDYNPNDEEPHTAASGSSRRHTHGPHAGKEHYKGVKTITGSDAHQEVDNERIDQMRRDLEKEQADDTRRQNMQQEGRKSLDPAACYGSCGQASGFFKMLAQEKAFGMPHQHEAMKHAQALCSILDAFGPSTNPADGYNPELAMQAGVEPGEMREKSAAPEHGGLSAALAGQQKMLADLGEELKFLRGQAARFLH